MLNFLWFLLRPRRHDIANWHKIEQVSDQMKYVWPTQWPEWRWHFQTHGWMNVYTVWNKLINGWGLRREMGKKSDCHSDRNQFVQRKKSSEWRRFKKENGGGGGQLEMTTQGMWFCIDGYDLITVWSTEYVCVFYEAPRWGMFNHNFTIRTTNQLRLSYTGTHSTAWYFSCFWGCIEDVKAWIMFKSE